MKKYIAFLVAAVMLILVACQPSQQGQPEAQPSTTTAPTQTTAALTETTKPTETTVSPTTVPATEPTEDLLADYEAWIDYRWSSDWGRYLVFRYDGELPDHPPGSEIDTSGMKLGYLYAVDFTYGKLDEISQGPCANSLYFYTIENIYYVLESEPSRVYCADHFGENRILLYESEDGYISEILYYGVDAYGKLILCENNNSIISYDTVTGEKTILMEAFYIEQFTYSPSSLYRESIIEHISEYELGDTISWKGKLYESDPEPDLGGDAYDYFVRTGEQWYIGTWEIR